MQGVLLSNFPLIFRIHSKARSTFSTSSGAYSDRLHRVPCTLIIEEIRPDHTIGLRKGHFYGMRSVSAPAQFCQMQSYTQTCMELLRL